MSFRGINTTVIQIRRQVFTEVARMAYVNVKGEQANHLMRKIPYTIIPGEEGKLLFLFPRSDKKPVLHLCCTDNPIPVPPG